MLPDVSHVSGKKNKFTAVCGLVSWVTPATSSRLGCRVWMDFFVVVMTLPCAAVLLAVRSVS